MSLDKLDEDGLCFFYVVRQKENLIYKEVFIVLCAFLLASTILHGSRGWLLNSMIVLVYQKLFTLIFVNVKKQ